MPDAITARRSARAAAAAQDGVLTRAQALECGVSAASLRLLVATGSWCRPHRGTYLLEPERSGVQRQRSWARSALLLAPGSVISHHTAAVLLGVQGVPRTGLVHLVSPREVLARPGLAPHRGVRHPDDVVDLDGLLVTGPVCTLADLLPRLSPIDGLSVLDSSLHLGVAGPEQLRRAAERTRGRRGSLGCADLWSSADGRAESPLESRVRFRCLAAGLVPVALQFEVRDERGILLARADAAFDREAAARAAGRPVPPGGLRHLLLEADGRAPHDSTDDERGRRQVTWDRRRQNALLAMGFTVVRCTWEDTLSRSAVPTAVLAQL